MPKCKNRLFLRVGIETAGLATFAYLSSFATVGPKYARLTSISGESARVCREALQASRLPLSLNMLICHDSESS